MVAKPVPIEEIDPELAEELQFLCRANAVRKKRGFGMGYLRMFPGGYSLYDGITRLPEHVVLMSRNEPCPCGSGRKYKKCCLRLERPQHPGRRQ